MISILADIRKKHEKTINYHIQTNREQYAIIKHLKETIIEKDAYAEQFVRAKDIQLEELRDSTVFKILKIFDKFRNKKEIEKL